MSLKQEVSMIKLVIGQSLSIVCLVNSDISRIGLVLIKTVYLQELMD